MRTGAVGHAVVSGHISRLLDGTNEDEEEVLGSALRVLLELERVGFSSKILRGGLSKAQRGAWVNARVLRQALAWTENEKHEWTVGYGASELQRREVEDSFVSGFEEPRRG